MKPRTIIKAKQVAFYFLVVLICAMVFNMASGAMEMYSDPNAQNPWYWALIAVGAIYAIPIVLVFIIYLVFRSKAKRVRKRAGARERR